MNEDQLEEMLSAYNKNRDPKIEAEILELARKRPTLLILPFGNSYLYQIGAELIVKLGYNVLKENLDDLMVWYQDINWPGVHIITDFLLTLPKNSLIHLIEKTIHRAKDDTMWLFGLGSLICEADLVSHFMSNAQTKELLLKGEFF